MPKLHNKYWMCGRCQFSCYAEIIEACPDCGSVHQLRYFINAKSSEDQDDLNNFDPWKEKDIEELHVVTIKTTPEMKRKHTQIKRRLLIGRGKEKEKDIL